MLEWMVVLGVVIGLPCAGLWKARQGHGPSLPARLGQITVVTTIVCLIAFTAGIRVEAIGLKLTKPWNLLAVSIVATGVLVLFDFASSSVLLRQPALVRQRLHALREWDRRARTHPVLLGLFILIAASYEEVLFRGFGFLVAGGVGITPLAAIVPLSFVFGLQHVTSGVGGIAFACLFGFIYACIYLMSGSLYPAIISHAAGNAFTIFYTRRRLVRCVAAEVEPAFLY